MPLSAAERSRRYREKLKENNPAKFEELKKKNAERTKNKKVKIADLDENEKEALRKQWRDAKRNKKENTEVLPEAAKTTADKRRKCCTKVLLENKILKVKIQRLRVRHASLQKTLLTYKGRIYALTKKFNAITNLINEETISETPVTPITKFIKEITPNMPEESTEKFDEMLEEADHSDLEPEEPPQPPPFDEKRGRGRPRKHKPSTSTRDGPLRKRSRPRKDQNSLADDLQYSDSGSLGLEEVEQEDAVEGLVQLSVNPDEDRWPSDVMFDASKFPIKREVPDEPSHADDFVDLDQHTDYTFSPAVKEEPIEPDMNLDPLMESTPMDPHSQLKKEPPENLPETEESC